MTAAPSPDRRPVHEALSTLYLDTGIGPTERNYIVRTLAASPHALDELETILLDQVHPVLAGNLLAVAGVWSGFDPDWLDSEIARHLRRPRLLRWWRGRLLRGHAREQWRWLAPAIAAARAAPPPGAA